MYARLVTFHFQPGTVDEKQMQPHSERNLAILRQQKGFITLYQLVDNNGKSVQLHVWESEADLETYLASAVAKEMQSRMAELMKDKALEPPVAEHFRVVAHS